MLIVDTHIVCCPLFLITYGHGISFFKPKLSIIKDVRPFVNLTFSQCGNIIKNEGGNPKHSMGKLLDANMESTTPLNLTPI